MKTLVLDTCHKYLVIGCFENQECLASFGQFAWKKQSELFFVALNECMTQANWNVDDIDQIVITKGPGSYTGERIAMTFAKVLCTTKKIDLYTVPTYMIFAAEQDCEVILDARSKRVYYGRCKDGKLINEGIKTLEEIKKDQENGIYIIGDLDLIDEIPTETEFAKNIMKVKNNWEKVENVHLLTPHYLKSQEELVQ